MLIYDPNSIFCLVDGGWATKENCCTAATVETVLERQQRSNVKLSLAAM